MERFKQISVTTRERTEFVKLDREIKTFVADSGVASGVCHVFVPHTTGGVMINEGADPSVVRDIGAKLAELVPREGPYEHADSERNADSHIKAALVGCSVLVPIENGAPALGRWQSVFFCEFDGPRQRQVFLTVWSTQVR